MNKRALRILEYNRIIEMLTNEAGSQMAKERISRFSPRGDVLLVRDLLSETTEAAEVIIKKGTLPIGELYDTEPLLHRARKGGSLTMKQLLIPVFKDGVCVYNDRPTVRELQQICKSDMATLWEESRRLVNPHEVHVDLSRPLYDLKQELLDKYHRV